MKYEISGKAPRKELLFSLFNGKKGPRKVGSSRPVSGT